MSHRRAGARLGILSLALAMLLAVSPFTPQAAHADLQNPRQQWLRDSTAGLFLHWGMRTSPGYTSESTWEKAVTSGGWTPDYWVEAAKLLHSKYLVLASFHSRLGYVRPWPSKIPGSPHSSRDFLGELIASARASNLKVILYMTDDPSHHDETGHEYLDSSGFSSYAGHKVDLTTDAGFGEFSYDNFFEVMKNYPDLAGFWIDNDNQYWLDHNLYQQIYQQRPNMLLSNNNEDTPIMDTVSNEQKTGMSPAYDMPQAYWTPQPRLTEADYKLPSSGAWWYDGSNSSVDYALNIGRYVANAGSSVKSLIAETAQVNGKFPANQVNFNNDVGPYLDSIWPSIGPVEGGGYLYGGMQPGAWNSGAYGVTTISKTDPDLQYMHVLTKPTSGSSVELRDNGYRVSSVTNLRTGAALSFSQSGGYLTISGVSGWDRYDTVFTVRTSGRTGVYTGVKASASSSKSGNPAGNLVDGSYLNYWDSNGKLPVTVTLDLGSAKKVQYLGVNQREWSVSYARSSTEQSARIKAYKLSVSTDGSSYTQVTSGTLKSARGVGFIDLSGAPTARYVRLEVDSTWAASSASKFYQQLRIDELWLGSAYATAATG
jgi:hypothetical protein